MAARMLVVAVIALGWASACRVNNSRYCENAPNSACATQEVCDPETQMCQECTAAEIDACQGEHPMCVHGTCGCALDTQCGSQLCLTDNRCAKASRTVYVAEGGGGDACSFEMPCATLVAGLARARDLADAPPGDAVYIKLTGHIVSDATITIDGDTMISIVGADASSDHPASLDLSAQATDVDILALEGNATVTLARLTVSRARDAGIRIRDTSPNVTLDHVTLDGNPVGIEQHAGQATIKNSTIRNSGQHGVVFGGGALTMTDSSIVSSGEEGFIGNHGLAMISGGNISDNRGVAIATNHPPTMTGPSSAAATTPTASCLRATSRGPAISPPIHGSWRPTRTTFICSRTALRAAAQIRRRRLRRGCEGPRWRSSSRERRRRRLCVCRSQQRHMPVSCVAIGCVWRA